MEITVTDSNGITLVGLEGRLDVLNFKEVGDRLLEIIGTEGGGVVIDMADISYVSSAGLRVLLQARKAAKAANRPMALCGASEFVADILKTTGFETLFQIVPDAAAACALLAGAGGGTNEPAG